MANLGMLSVGVGLAATDGRAQLVQKLAGDLKNGEFNWFPERSAGGPLLIIVSIPEQLVHVYRNGIRIAASTCSTGKPGHRTPTGVFKILQKDKHHRSSTYSNAPMPNMNRLTWSGIALHAGQLPGYPASHGCVRLPMQFSEMLFGLTKLGMTVVIADSNSQPESVVHPGLVLGDYARKEYGAVDASLLQKAYSEGHVDSPPSSSLVISRADSRAKLFRNDKLLTEGLVSIAEPRKPLGEKVYSLQGSDSQTGTLHWTSADVGRAQKSDLDAGALKRIKADPPLREAIRQNLHKGMTIVTTDQPSRRINRSNGDFVIMDGIY